MVVEMSCDTSTNLPYLAERVGSERSVVVVDLFPGVLDMTRERTHEFPQVHLVRGGAIRPPIARDPGTSPAAILATFVPGMFDDPTVVISSWTDLVSPDGRLCLIDLAETTDSRWRPLNPTFRVLVRVAALPEPCTMCASPAKLLNRRLIAAHRVLKSRCRVTHEATHTLGLARVRADVVE